VRQIVRGKPQVENQYSRVAKKSGNLKAQKVIAEVFRQADASWRGLGRIPKSGLKLRSDFAELDAEKVMPLKIRHVTQNRKQKLCRCGQVIKGLLAPDKCPLFRKACTPENPFGPCMVSIEGACNAYYKYH